MVDRGPVCIVGAGLAGLAMARQLRAAGVAYVGYECGSGVGGLWRYGNDSGLSVAYRSLRSNTSKQRSAFADFPMPTDFPDYPDHTQILAYLEAYAALFGLTDGFQFRQRVVAIRSVGDRWEVTAEPGGTTRHPAVVVATGHNWAPRRAELPGHFGGLRIHAAEYRTPDLFRGRRVVVVGLGASGADIACEAAGVGEQVYLSTRHGRTSSPGTFSAGRRTTGCRRPQISSRWSPGGPSSTSWSGSHGGRSGIPVSPAGPPVPGGRPDCVV